MSSEGGRPLRYSINISLDGCYDHTAMAVSRPAHDHATAILRRADALLLGRVTYELMESAWRLAPGSPVADEPFAQVIDAAPKHVVSSTLTHVDWNAELVRGDLREEVLRLKAQPGEGLYVGGVRLPQALVEMGLVDEVELVVHPRVVGRGPTLFAGLSRPLDLDLVGRTELDDGVVALRYRTR